MTMFRRILSTIICALITLQTFAVSTPTGKVCVLDITSRISEIEASSRNVYSAEYMMELAGLPYFTTTSLSDAMQQSTMILLSSEVKKSAFTADELNSLSQWVENGGILVSPAASVLNNSSADATAAKNLFGVSGINKNKARYQLIWSADHYNDKELEYIDEPEERTTSLGRGKKLTGESINSFAYTLSEGSDAEVLANFDDNTNAVIRRSLGKGKVYLFGYLWRDVIQRSQLNKDFEAQRQTSNAFEPSADVTPLFLRSAFTRNQRVSVWKFTIPDGFQSLIIPTHDCDSRTAYDSMFYMSEYERDLRLKAHYFLTVHYFRDAGYLSAFYDNITKEKARLLLNDGHTVGSHSVCHFPDFSKTDRFPMTVVTKEEYAQMVHHEAEPSDVGISTGGSTWAEVVLSKQIIEDDLGNDVRSFRTGHLCMNNNIPLAEQQAGYEFSSCFAAGDVLSEFPFRERLGKTWDGDFNGVLVMPLHISDVISADPINADNWPEKSAMWHEVQGKLQGNYAPAILLIHPNRKWKMLAEELFVNMTDLKKVGLYNFEDWGDFWNARRQLDFDYVYNETDATLDINLNNAIQTVEHLRFAIDLTSVSDKVEDIRIFNSEGKQIAHGEIESIADNRLLVTPQPYDATEITDTPSTDEDQWNGTAEIYNIAGMQQPALSRGFFIVRDRNGNTRKILNK